MKKELSQKPGAIRSRRYYAKHVVKERARSKKARKAHPEKGRARGRKHSALHPNAKKIANDLYKIRHPGRAEIASAAWKKRTPLWQITYRAKNPEQHKGYIHKRLARKRKATIEEFTPAELKTHIAALGGVCVYCGGPYEHLDHVYPLSRGGAHILANLVPSCASCNLRKGSKLPIQWLTSLPGFGTLKR